MKYASEYFPEFCIKAMHTLQSLKAPWKFAKIIIFKRKKYVSAINGFSLND